MSSNKDRAQFTAGLVLSALPWLIAPSTIAPFIGLYGAMGVDVPAATRLLMDHPQWLLGLALPVLAAWYYPGWRARRGPASLAAGLAVAAVGYLSMVLLLYWPTFAR